MASNSPGVEILLQSSYKSNRIEQTQIEKIFKVG